MRQVGEREVRRGEKGSGGAGEEKQARREIDGQILL